MNDILKKSQVKLSLIEIQNCNCSKDRQYTLGPLEKTLKFLEDNNIHDIPDFTSLLAHSYFKSKEIVDCFQLFVDDFNRAHEDQKIIFNRRSFRQLRYYHKNFEIARLVLDHGDSLLTYLRNYVAKKLSKIEIENFMSEMQQMFNIVKKQAVNNRKNLLFGSEMRILTNSEDDDFDLYFNNNDDDSCFKFLDEYLSFCY